jgi:hypothetical protein
LNGSAAVAGATGILVPPGAHLTIKVDPNLSTQWIVGCISCVLSAPGNSVPPEIFTVGTGGTTINTLVQTDTSNPAKVIASTTGSYGVALATASAAAVIAVQREGIAPCVVDSAGNATAGDLAILGTGSAIDCKDSGQTASSAISIATRIIGTFLTSASSGATALVELTPAHFGTLVTGAPCTTTALSIQYDSSGAFGCIPDFTFSTPHTLLMGASGILNLSAGAAESFIGPVSLVMSGTTAGFVDYPQGSTSASVAPCNVATSVCIQAPASVTSYVQDLPGAAPTNNFSASLCSDANPSVCSFAKMPQTAITSGSAYTNATTSFTSVVGGSGQTLSFSVEASTNYYMTCSILWSASAATAGPKFQITGPSSPTAVQYSVLQAVTATTDGTAGAVAFSTSLNASGTTVVASTNEPASINMGLVNGSTAGTVTVQAAAQGTGTVTIQPGSYCTLQ